MALGQTSTSDISYAPTTSISAADSESAAASANRFYGSIDYLLFEFRDGPAPGLIQHVPSNQVHLTPLPQGAAQTMYGNGIRHHAFSGFRAEAGFWLNDNWAGEVSFMQFESKNKGFRIDSEGEPSIGRHYIDLTNNSNPITYLIYARPQDPSNAANGRIRGYIDASSPIRLWGLDINARAHGYSVFADHCDWLVGFRYVDLRDGIFISDFTQFFDATGTIPGTSYLGEDRFYATNQFYGPQVGFNSMYEFGGVTLDVTGKIAMGGVRQKVAINGITTERDGNGVLVNTVPGDVLTQSTNIGSYSRSRFAFVPELLVKLGYNVGQHVNVSVGYNILAVTSVVRAGGVIDEGVNPNVSPYLGAAGQSDARRPGFNFHGTDFWAQGLTLGFAVKY